MSLLTLNRDYATRQPPLGTQGVDWDHPLARQLIGLYVCNEGHGSLLNDLCGNVGNSVLASSSGATPPTWTTSPYGNAVSFTYANQTYGSLPNLPRLSGDFSFECLVNMQSEANNYLFSDWSGSYRNYLLYAPGGSLNFYTGNGFGSSSTLQSTPIVYGTWNHFVVTRQGFVTCLYVNGVLRSQQTNTYSGGVTPQARYLFDDGAFSGGSADAQVSKVGIYTRALSANDVALLFKEPFCQVEPPFQARFYFSSPVAVPVAPASLNAIGSGLSINLSWASSATATSYSVFKSTVSGSGYSLVASGVSGTTYTDLCAAGQTFYYVVRAVNVGGSSGNSPQASAFTQPTAPAQLAGTSGNGQVTLNAGVAAGGGSVSYNLYDGTSQGAEGGVAVLTGQTTPAALVLSGLTNGQKYFFFVTAQNAAGESAHSNETGVIPSASAGSVSRRISQGFA